MSHEAGVAFEEWNGEQLVWFDGNLYGHPEKVLETARSAGAA